MNIEEQLGHIKNKDDIKQFITDVPDEAQVLIIAKHRNVVAISWLGDLSDAEQNLLLDVAKTMAIDRAMTFCDDPNCERCKENA
jgi:Mg-chelatase subunit ChlI